MGATHGHERPGRAPLEPDPRLPPPTPPGGPAPASAADPEEPPGLIANRYRLLARIHASSAGTLYRAEDVAFSRSVALRILTPALSHDEAMLARLQARLQAGAAMNRDDLGADIIELTDLGRADDGLVFVVTEFLAGDSLATQLAREGPLPWRTLRPLMVRACQLIHLSHQHGLLRLDLQTRHFFPIRDKTRTSTLKILSTGIGDVFGDNLWSSLSPAAAAAHLRYAAPEQVTGGTVDARTDVYALGVIMYELLTGRVPFPDARPAYLCARHLLEPVPLLTTGAAGPIPEAVAAIVARALAKAPDDRWPTMRALANAMAAIDFGPCDASGMLEVVDALPITPATSSASMRIDPTARHAPSPTVRPKTLPPLRDAFLADPPPADDLDDAVTRVGPAPSARSAARHPEVRERPVLSASSEPRAGSSSAMAWEEILAAADEAIAVVADVAGTGTAGDSGVFIPESLLRSGAATTASMTRGRLAPAASLPASLPTSLPVGTEPTLEPDAASSHGDTVVLPRTVLLRADAAAASTTLQLEEADLGDLGDPAGDSAADLPALGARPPALVREPETSLAAASTLDRAPPPGDLHASVTEVAATSHGSTDSAGSLRAAIDRSAVWPLAARSQLGPSPSRPLAWAAALVLMIGGVAAGVRFLRPSAPTHAPIAAASPAPRPTTTALPAAIARPRDLSPGTGSSVASPPTSIAPSPHALPGDLSDETASAPTRDRDVQWPHRAAEATTPPPITREPEPAALAVASVNAPAAPPPAAIVSQPAPRPATAPRHDRDPPTVSPPVAPAPAKAVAPAIVPPETSPTPPPGPRKSSPGAHLPDAGHELAAPIDHDPMRAATLLGKAEQAAARGEQGLALSLAIQSYHAQPSNNALVFAGKQACKVGDPDKVRWARLHLPPGEHGPVEAACKAAGLALE